MHSMERYYDFEKIRQSAHNAVATLARDAGLDERHPLVTYAVLDALAKPLHHMRSHGWELSTSIARSGIEAYTTSLLARRVEELKSPHSKTINDVMDRIVDALSGGRQPCIDHENAFKSATEYLVEGGLIEKLEDGTLRLID